MGTPGYAPRLLTKKQAAAEFGICYRTIERWYNIGYINRIRIGGRIFFSYAEILRIRDQSMDGYVHAGILQQQARTVDEIRGRYDNRIGERR